MDHATWFGAVVLATSVAGLLAVQSRSFSERLRVPTPALFLAVAAVAALVVPGLDDVSPLTVERIVTVALVVILFDGGLSIGLPRFRASAASILTLGVAGTFLTTAATAVLAHVVLDVHWYLAVLVATAVAPTDPAVVFSVLGRREVEGRAGTVLEGESGANDPVGISLMAALIGAGGLSGAAVGHAAGTFLLQMSVGTLVGLVGARLLLRLSRRSFLPTEALYPVRSLLAAGGLFGLAVVLHGSGFLAVFVAGLVLGREPSPYGHEVVRFHAALAALAEVVAFGCLGLTVDLHVLARADVWVPGVVLGLLLALVVRPVVAAPLLSRSSLVRGERAFIMLTGLKGAVPLLLGSFLLHQEHGARLYGVVVVVVLVSVVGQGSLVPTLARWTKVRMTPRERRAAYPETG